MGQIKWVLEEKPTNQFSLTFSPNSSSELYQLTRALVGSAPIDLSNWHFYDAVQSTGEMNLLVYDQNMDTLSFDLTNWEASLKKEPNGKYFIEVNMYQYVEDEDLETVVVDLGLNALLGEGPKLQILSGFDISSELDGPSKPFAAQCAFLKNEMR